MEQASEAVFIGDAAEGLHGEHLVIVGEVGAFEDGGDFILGGGHFVMARFDGNAELVELMFAVEHTCEHALGNGAEVMIFHFLALRGHRAEKGAARVDQVGAGEVEVFVDQKVFLFRADSGEDFFALLAEELEDADRLGGKGFHGAKKRGFFVEGFAGPGDERGGDHQDGAVGVFEDVRR